MGIASDANRGINIDSGTIRRLTPSVAEIVYSPHLVSHAWGAELVAKRDNPKIITWGLWGAVAAAVVGFTTLVYEGYRGFNNWYTVGIAVSMMTVALLTARFGPRTSLVTVSLARIDLHRRHVEVDGTPPLPFDDVREVVYAMVKYPVEKNPRSVKVDAFTVMLRNAEGNLMPLLEASPDKNEVFRIAKACSTWTGLEITHVGLGVKS